MAYHFGQNIPTSSVNNTSESHDGVNEEKLEDEVQNEEQQGIGHQDVLVYSNSEMDEDPINNFGTNPLRMKKQWRRFNRCCRILGLDMVRFCSILKRIVGSKFNYEIIRIRFRVFIFFNITTLINVTNNMFNCNSYKIT